MAASPNIAKILLYRYHKIKLYLDSDENEWIVDITYPYPGPGLGRRSRGSCSMDTILKQGKDLIDKRITFYEKRALWDAVEVIEEERKHRHP